MQPVVPPPGGARSSSGRLFAFVPVLLGAVVRALAWCAWARWPGSSVAILDPAWHLGRAAAILGGDLADGTTTWVVAPGPAYLFALAGRLASLVGFGTVGAAVAPGTAVAVSLLLDLGVVEVVRRLGVRLGGAQVGLLAGIAAAVSGPFVFHDLTLLCVAPAALGLGLALLLVLGEETWLAALGAGLALGFAVWFRPNLLLLFPLPALAAGRRRAIGVVLGLALALAPGLVRNRLVGGEWVPISANAGANLWMAQQPGLTTNFPPPVPGPNNLGAMTAWFQAQAEAAAGHALSPGAADGYWRDKARDAIRATPGAVADRTFRRFLLALSTIDVQDHYDWRTHRRTQPLLGALPDFGWVAPGLAAVGAWLAWRRGLRRESLVLVAAVVGVAVSLAPFVVVERYRLPGAVAALPLAAAAATWIIRERRWAAALAALAISFVASVDPFRGGLVLPDVLAVGGARSWTDVSGPGRAADEASNLAAAFIAAGDTTNADVSFRQAIAAQPGRTADLVNLAALLEARGAHTEAVALLRAEITAHPTNVDATLALCGLHLKVPAEASDAVRTCTLAGELAPTRWDALFQAAMAYWQVGDLPAARTTLLAAQSLQPTNPRIRAALASLSKP